MSVAKLSRVCDVAAMSKPIEQRRGVVAKTLLYKCLINFKFYKCLIVFMFKVYRLRDYSALRASPARFARDRRRYAPALNVAARRCRTLLVLCRGFELRTFGSTCEAASFYRVTGYAG
jgi:hypothetical protein